MPYALRLYFTLTAASLMGAGTLMVIAEHGQSITHAPQIKHSSGYLI